MARPSFFQQYMDSIGTAARGVGQAGAAIQDQRIQTKDAERLAAADQRAQAAETRAQTSFQNTQDDRATAVQRDQQTAAMRGGFLDSAKTLSQSMKGNVRDFQEIKENREKYYEAQARLMNQMNPNQAVTPEMLRKADKEKQLIGGKDDPSSVQEYRFFSNLSPEEQSRYLEMKRSQKTLDLGGVHALLGPGGQVAQTYGKTLRPGERPEVKGAQAAATEAGKISSQIEGAAPLREARGEITPEEEKMSGSQEIMTVTEKLKENYNKLRDMGGIVDTEQNSLNNIIAKGKSSALGQAFQSAVGSDAQSIREEIKQLRTFGLLAIKKAADLGTTSMNTAAEMRIFLDLATNPDADFQSNMAALDVFQKMYAKELANAGGPKQIGTEEDYSALPSGAQFYDPDGNLRRKP